MLSLEAMLKTAGEKCYFRGTHRSRAPEDTFLRVRPRLDTFGITRVANVTGLDKIGIPVYLTMRPNSRSLSVAQGKGVDAAAAKVSSVMEAIEAHHAEFNSCLTRLESYQVLRSQEPVAHPEALPLRKGGRFSERRPLPWALGFDLLKNEPVWVPFELVHANATVPAVPGSGCFASSTNGLASGNELTEAVLHGLYEVIERDALALWQHSAPSRFETDRLNPSTVDDPACVELLSRFEKAEISATAWNITSDVEVAAFYAMVVDPSTDHLLKPVPGAYGVGCHLDRGVALARALTEAAQTRLTIIAGSRDDVTRAHYRGFQAEKVLEFDRRIAASGPGRMDFRSTPSSSNPTFKEDLLRVLTRLGAAGIERVIVVDLSRPGLPLSVVRVIVPGLEGPSESPWYQPGVRVRGRSA
jgi:YcaO-like protein with predicted kinase domain